MNNQETKKLCDLCETLGSCQSPDYCLNDDLFETSSAEFDSTSLSEVTNPEPPPVLELSKAKEAPIEQPIAKLPPKPEPNLHIVDHTELKMIHARKTMTPTCAKYHKPSISKA
jgi:hypothetical protein